MSKQPTDRGPDRRRLFGAAAGAAGAALALAGTAEAAITPAPPISPTRARFSISKDWAIPKSAQTVYVTPIQTALFNDGDCVLNSDYTITVNKTGLYLCYISFDWSDAPSGQVGLRINGISHTTPDSPPGVFKAGKLTVVDGHDDRIGQYDVTCTTTPKTARYQGTWKPGLIAKGKVVSTDVPMDIPGQVTLGDFAFASHAGITDALGDAAAALIVTAKVVGANTVRVSIYNSGAVNAQVPSGKLKVVAMSSTTNAGDAPLGRSMLMTATETLNAGDLIYGTFKSTQMNDTLLASPNTFLQIERWG